MNSSMKVAHLVLMMLVSLSVYSSVSEAAALDGCYSVDKTARAFLVSAGSYDPETLDPDICVSSCANQLYSYAALYAGQFCLCSTTTLALIDKQPDETQCSTPCPGDSSRNCGFFDYILVYKVSDTPVVVTVDPTTALTSGVGNITDVVVLVSNSGPTIMYDFGDGTAPSESSDHVYTAQGDYIVSVTAKNDAYAAFDAIPVRVESAVSAVNLTCPESAGVSLDFECIVEILGGSDLRVTPTFDGNVGTSLTNVGVPYYFTVGNVTQDSTLSATLRSDDLHPSSAETVTWVMPGLEVTETSKLIAFEVLVTSTGILELVIFKPVCQLPSQTYCPVDNVCTASCDFDWTQSSQPTKQDTCAGGTNYCLAATGCAGSSPCTAKPDRYVRDPLTDPRADYEVVEILQFTSGVLGYHHAVLDSPIDVEMGYLLGFRTDSSSGQIGYDESPGGLPVEFMFVGSPYSVGHTFGVLNIPSGHDVRHHLRGTFVLPARASLKHAFDVPDVYEVLVDVSNPHGPTVAAATTILVQEIVSGLTVDVEKEVVKFGETIALSARIAGGAGVNYTWDWGDNFEETTVRQAATFNDSDIMVYTYGLDGVYTITVTAINQVNNETVSTTVYVQRPITRDHFLVTSNSPQPHPGLDLGSITFYVTLNLPPLEFLGTGAMFDVSTDYFENSTAEPITARLDGDVVEFDHDVRFSGEYTARATIRNKITSVVYTLQIAMVEPITGFEVVPMFNPPLPVGGPETVGFGPGRNVFPLDTPVIFVPKYTTGSDMTYTINYGDISPLDTGVVGAKFPHIYTQAKQYTASVRATNAFGSSPDYAVVISLEENIGTVTITDVKATSANESKEFDITIAGLGTASCLMVDFDDGLGSQAIYGDWATCGGSLPAYPTAIWSGALATYLRLTHTYQRMDSYKITAVGFNRVSDASAEFFFAVSDFSCNTPRLSIRDGHPDWRGPRVLRRADYLQLQGVTSVECLSVRNHKTWTMEEIDPGTGAVIPGSLLMLTGLSEGHWFYLPDSDTAEINFSPRVIAEGTWRFTYTVHMIRLTDSAINYESYAREYVQVRASPLEVYIISGQTTAKVVGYGDFMTLEPGLLSRDPDLPEGAAHQNFSNIEYLCRRFYEPWIVDDDKNIQKSNKIALGSSNKGEVNEGGCFGTGIGLLDHSGPTLNLDTHHCLVNMTYEIMVIVTKESRVANASIFFTVKEGNPPQPTIRCSGGTLYQVAHASLVVNPTDDFRLEGYCERNCHQLVYLWDMDYYNEEGEMVELDGWMDHATGYTTMSLYINKDVFTILPDILKYAFTFHIANAAGEAGKAHMEVSLNKPPEGGVCTLSHDNVTSDDEVEIVCTGWTDEQGISSYEFFVVADVDSANKIVGFGGLPVASFYPPQGKVTDGYLVRFGVEIDDTLGATTIYSIGHIIVRPSNFSGSGFLSEENTQKVEHKFESLAAEGNSRVINNVVLIGAARLNELRSSQLPVTNNETSYTTTVSPVSSDEATLRNSEANRIRRAYWRKNMADLQGQGSLDTLSDVLNSASTATVLTEATDELSHGALSAMADLGEKMLGTLQSMAGEADQKTVAKTVGAMFETFANVLEGSAKTITSPLWLLDDLEDTDHVGDYSELNKKIDEQMTVTEASMLTTADSVSDTLKADKNRKARSIVAQTDKLLQKVVDVLKKNKLPREPPSIITTQAATLTVARSDAADLTSTVQVEGDGSFSLPSWCSLNGGTNDDCNSSEIIDIQSNSFRTNHYNYMETSDRISDKSHLLAMKFHDPGGAEIPIVGSTEPIVVWIPRPKTETPQCGNYGQNFNTTSARGLSLHSFEVQYDQTTVTLEVIPEEFYSVQYAVLVRYLYSPAWEQYDKMWIMPPNVSSGANISDYTIYLDQDFISNRTGTYYIGIAQIPQEPQLDSPILLFGDDYSPKELLDQLLQLDRVFNFTANYTLCIYVSGCAYFDNTTQEWSTEGVQVGPLTTKDKTQCFSYHLTDFGSTWIVPPTPLDFEDIFTNFNLEDNLTIFITTIVIYVLFFFIFVWARRKDRKDLVLQGLTPMADNKPNDKYLYEVMVMTGQWKDSGTDSKVHFILSGEDDETDIRTLEDDKRPILKRGGIDRFVMAVRRPLGMLNYIRLWHDNAGKGSMQSWFVEYIAIRDLQTKERFYFIANRWFSLVDGDGEFDHLLPVAGKEQMKGFGHLFSSHSRKNLNDGHLWFSIFLRPVGSRFTRVQRAACCLMALWLEMLVNIMWYEVVPPAPAANAFNIGPFSLSIAQITIGVQASLVVFPVTLLVVQIFRKARPRRRLKTHRQIIKEQQKAAGGSAYRVGREDVISQSHVIMEGQSGRGINTRSDASLLDNQQSDADSPTPSLLTTASYPPQTPAKKKKKTTKMSFPWWTIFIGWFLCILSIAAATFFTFLYGVQFGDEKTKEWLTSLVVTFATGILCTQPIKIILVAIFVALIIKSPNADEEEADGEEEEEPAGLDKDEMWLHNFSSTSERKPAYKPPDPANLERIRDQRLKELKMYNILREIAFYIIFLWTLMVFCYSNVDPYAFYMKDQYTSILTKGDGINTFYKVNNVKRFWQWMDTGLVPNLYANEWYNGETDMYQTGYFSDRQSYILGSAILRQVRIKRSLCEVHDLFEDIIPECNGAFTFFNEDTQDYAPRWQTANTTADIGASYHYTKYSELDGYPFLGRHALYPGGGYAVKIEGTVAEMRRLFHRLYDEAWIDKYTRAVFVEFAAYNPQVNLFGVVEFVVEFLPTGAGQAFNRVDVIRLLTYTNGFALVRIFCEVLFFLFILFFIVKEIRNARRERRQYLRNFWNWTECSIILFSLAAAGIYFYRLYVANGIIDTLKSNKYQYIKLQYVAYWNELLSYLLGWVVFLATLKFLKMLRFNRRIGILSSTIRNCSKDLSYFGLMFSIIFLAFAIAFYLLFNRNLYDYSNFVSSCETLISAILGKFKFYELTLVERFLGPVLFFLFMGCMSYILINMFLTIINESFKVVNSDISKQSNEFEMVDFMIRRLKKWTGMGKPSAPDEQKPGQEDEDKGSKQDIVKEFPEKVDQLLNSIAKIYFDHDSFDEVIRGRGNKKAKKVEKKMITV